MYRTIAVILLSAFVISSCTFDVCSSKRMYVNSYDQFIKKIEKNQNDFSENDWKEMDEKFERFSGECFDKFKDDLSKNEREEIMKNNFTYVVSRVKSELPFKLNKENEKKVNDFIEDMDFDDLKGTGEELKEIWEGFDTDKFKEAADELGKGFEKLEKAFENFGEELMEMFEESKEENSK